MPTRSEELARLKAEWDSACERWLAAGDEVPRDPSRCDRLFKEMVAARQAHNRLNYDWFPPEYADCVDDPDMCMFGRNQGKIRPYGSKGPWRPFPKDPFWDLYV
jgi:hypothetical protein